MSAQKRVKLNEYGGRMLMRPDCHPDRLFKVVYVPERGGDAIKILCEQCDRNFFTIKLPTERP